MTKYESSTPSCIIRPAGRWTSWLRHCFVIRPFVIRHWVRGFTLLELTVAMAILSVLLVGLGSAVMLASRAVPDGKSYGSAVLAAGSAVDQIALDIGYATSITTHTATELIFTVPDRNGDASPETIRYWWSGTPGDPLLCQWNGNAAVPIADSVQEFQLGYDVRSEPLPTTYSEGGETLLACYTPYYDVDAYTVDNTHWIAQCFTPALPADATSWSVTRIRIRLRANGTRDGQIAVQLRTTAGGIPSPFVLAETLLAESTLDWDFRWIDIAFQGATGISPSSGLCILVKPKLNSPPCDVRYDDSAPSGGMARTSDAGSSWTLESWKSLRYYVYGKVVTPGPAAYQQRLTSVRVRLRCGTDGRSRVQTSIPVLNQPQVVGP